MAGHSAWKNIKHRKARQDALRGRAWTRCARAIIVAARNGGGDPTFNPSLRLAIDDAKAENMPKDTIEKAIRKGTGDLDGVSYEQVRYEGYGPGGVAIIVDCLTDKSSRTAPELRTIFEKNGGNLAKPGAVAFSFEATGVLLVEAAAGLDEERIIEVALEAGADDVEGSEGGWEIRCAPPALVQVKDGLARAGVEALSAEVAMVPMNTVAIDEGAAATVQRLLDALEEHDDVQKIWNNAELPAEVA
ncbi:MAG TPA: YebC/PmpR family DNA-binding transcriptional regulator [Phycisphaerales bacterium]|nr:YebC/PmpR family DNA-binding transcriptional regulator [Phycisphaerales bacterium]HMP36587.1 YebC/PmpR family DNA-binding transcriptional regulator [Phycisphaerales bacterium]